MESQRAVAAGPRVEPTEIRHCSVCFAVIGEGEGVRSREGHCYCARCAAVFFDNIDLLVLGDGACLLPPGELLSA